MGGYGSGYRGPAKTTVEDCLVLSVNALVRHGLIGSYVWRSGTWIWSRSDDAEPYAQIGYEADVRDGESGTLRLRYRASGQDVDDRVPLVSTRPNFGGLRWWFLCPARRHRVAKLYLPPGGRHFASRQAYDLTYTSCQESGKFASLHRLVAARLGTDEAMIRRALRSR